MNAVKCRFCNREKTEGPRKKRHCLLCIAHFLKKRVKTWAREKRLYFVFFVLLFVPILPPQLIAAVPDDLAIRAIVGEAENQGPDGMYALACAIRNRGHLRGVYGLKAPRVVKNQVPAYILKQAAEAWRKSAAGPDPTGGADHWENINAFGVPSWAAGMKKTAVIKDHVFYKEKK